MSLDLKTFASTVKVTDGAWGTQLQKQGLPAGSPPEVWNALNPSAVEAVASAYVAAGSDVIITNTFGANKFIFESHAIESRVPELAEKGVLISRKAAGARPGVKVFASIGPSGKIVMMGETNPNEILAAFAEAAEACSFGGADAILLESFAELDELAIALRAVKRACDLPVVASMTFGSGADKTVTMMGNKPSELAAMAVREGASAVGANCGVGPESYVRVAAMLREACDLPIWIKANAGLPTVSREGTVFPMGPMEFADFVPRLVEAGANFIGGCCGTTPDHIRAVCKALGR